MTLKGDLKNINLADIFQTLSMNQQEGTLTIVSGPRRMDIYFSKEGVRLLTTGDRKYPRLGEMLLKEKKITPVELDMALARQKMTGELIGQALIDMGIVTAEDIEGAVRNQIEEEIFDVFSWKDAKFEFVPGEPKGEFFDPARLGRPITFNVSGIIMEAARRIDEWEMIHKVLPSMQVILRVHDPYAELPPVHRNLGVDPEDVKAVVDLVDGKKLVEHLTEESHKGKFETCKILAALVQANYLEPLSVQEMVAAADQYGSEGDIDTAIKMYRAVLENLPPSSVLRNRLAQVYEQAGRNEEAAAEYAMLADALLEEGSDEDAFSLYKKALELAPKKFSLHQKLLEFYLQRKDGPSAVQEGLFVARTYWRMNRLAEAKEVLDRLVPLAPDNMEIRQMLINISLDMEDGQEAVKHYEHLVKMHEAKGDVEGVIEMYRKILAIDRNRGDIRAALEKLLARGGAKRSKAPLVLGVGIIAVLVALGALYWWYNSTATKQYDSLVAEIERLADDGPKMTFSDWENGVRALGPRIKKFEATYGYALLAGADQKARLLKDRLRKLQVQLQEAREEYERKLEDRRRAINAKIIEAEGVYSRSGDHQKAIALLREALAEAERDMQNLGALAAEARTLIKGITKEVDEAGMLWDDAQGAIRLRNWALAFKKLRELADRYPKTRRARDAKLPLEVHTVPAGAFVTVGSTREGTTPLVLWRKPGTTLYLTFAKRGFGTVSARAVRDDVGRVEEVLKRVSVWGEFKTGVSPLDLPLNGHNDRIYVSCLSGRVVCVKRRGDSAERLWSYRLPAANLLLQARPTVSGGLLLLVDSGGADGHLRAVSADRGEEQWSMPLQRVVRERPVPGERGAVYMSARSAVIAVNAEQRRLLWNHELDPGREQVSTPPLWDARHRHVIFGVQSRAEGGGRVVAVNAEDGRLVWEERFSGGAPVGEMFICGETVVSVLSNGIVVGLFRMRKLPESDEGEKVARCLWRHTLAAGVSVGAACDGTCVYVLDDTGKLHAVSTEGNPGNRALWSRQMEMPARGVAPVVSDRNVYVLEELGRKVTAVANGLKVWSYSLPDDCKAMTRPCVVGDLVVVGLEDGRLLALVR